MDVDQSEVALERLRDAMEYIVQLEAPWQHKRDMVAQWMRDKAGGEWFEFMSWFDADVEE